MDLHHVTTDPGVGWGTPCLRDTGVTVRWVVALHRAGFSTARILERCPELTARDVDAALAWALEAGGAGLGARPPHPGPGNPRITVDPAVHDGHPTIRGTRITVDAVVGLREHGFAIADILREYPALEPEDVDAAVAYAREAER